MQIANGTKFTQNLPKFTIAGLWREHKGVIEQHNFDNAEKFFDSCRGHLSVPYVVDNFLWF